MGKPRIFLENPATIRIHHGVAHLDVGISSCDCAAERSMSLETLEESARRCVEALTRYRNGERDVVVGN